MRFLLCGLFILLGLSARAEFKVPALTGPVVDLAGMITSVDKSAIEGKIRAFNNSGLAQLQVLTVESLEGLTIEQASMQVAEAWKLGTEKQDNGLLIMIAKNERRVRIEVGQGLEGVMPDIYARRIVSDVMIPFFRQNIPSQGVVQGVDRIIEVIQKGEGVPEKKIRKSPFEKYKSLFIIIFLLVIFSLNIFTRNSRRFGGWGGGWGGGGFGGGGFGGGGGGWSGGGGGFSGGGGSDGW